MPPQHGGQSSRERWPLVLAFTSGMSILAVEMAGSRLLAPYFGASLLVWANLIGLIMVYLAAGYWLGGRLADRFPQPEVLYRLGFWAGFFMGVIPIAARPVLGLSSFGLGEYSLEILLGSFLAVLLLFLLPVVFMGCISPFVIRLQTLSVLSTGQTAGRIYALSTLGSILGTFLPVLMTIPLLGTRGTFILFAAVLMLVAWAGLVKSQGRRAWRYLALLLLVLGLWLFFPASEIKASPGIIYEEESAYNYIQVVQEGEDRFLLLNEGQAIHSFYNSHRLLSYGIWDYFLLAPFFYPEYSPQELQRVLIIGLAGGTVAKEYTAIFGPIPIVGVEIDPQIIEVGRRLFAMDEPNLQVVAQDGRYFLTRSTEKYDVIVVDAYQQPYIPFYMTTREFFELARDHLAPRGAVAINAGRTRSDARLVEVLAATMSQVFPDVYILDALGDANSLIIGTSRDTELEDFYTNREQLSHPALREVASFTEGRVHRFVGNGEVYTDDWAPVEQLIHLMALRFLLQGE